MGSVTAISKKDIDFLENSLKVLSDNMNSVADRLKSRKVTGKAHEKSSKTDMERIYHGHGGAGGDPGVASCGRKTYRAAGVHSAVRLHGADLSHRFCDLC